MPICNIKLISKKPSYLPFPDENDQSLGADLKRRRLTLEWTQEDTAKHFEIIKDSYQKWEWNHITPDIKKRKKVVEFLGFNHWDEGHNSLANRVLLFRIENQLYRTELAKLIQVSDSTVERVEKNRSCISLEIQERFEVYIRKYFLSNE